MFKGAINPNLFLLELDFKRLQEQIHVGKKSLCLQLSRLEFKLIAVEFEVEYLRQRHLVHALCA
jgi:hypothetical protein